MEIKPFTPTTYSRLNVQISKECKNTNLLGEGIIESMSVCCPRYSFVGEQQTTLVPVIYSWLFANNIP